MSIDYQKLLHWDIPQVEQQLTRRDTIIYALGVGLGAAPMDQNELQFVLEQNLKALPTMAIMLGYPGPWHASPGTGVTRSHVVHGEQGFTIHKPLPVEGAIIGKTRVTAVLDKGKDRGALLLTACDVRDKASNDLICTLTSTTFCRADGGFGGPSGPTPAPHPIPETPAQHSCDLPTLPQAALIYRLSGDYNPLHAEPAIGRAAGFKQPILHGLCTYGVAGRAILKTICGYDSSKLMGVSVRFSSPVYPGETIRTEMYRDGKRVLFRSRVVERDVVVLSNGVATLA